MSEAVVLDASALLAVINDEPGGERVRPVMPRALVSAVNLAEAAAVLLEIGVATATVRSGLGELGVTTVPFDDALAFAAAELRPRTRARGCRSAIAPAWRWRSSAGCRCSRPTAPGRGSIWGWRCG